MKALERTVSAVQRVANAASNLSKEAATPSAKQPSERVLAELREAFSLFDKDSSGSIDSEELCGCLHTLGVYPTPLELEELMNQMDTDGNGTIEFQEFREAMHKHQEMEDMEKELESIKGVFMLLDTDGNGRLDCEELRRAMKILGVDMSPEETEHLLGEIDIDGDGTVTFEEFAAHILAFEEEMEDAHHH